MTKQNFLDNSMCTFAQIADCVISNNKQKGIDFCNELITKIYIFVIKNYNGYFLYELTKSKQENTLLSRRLENKYFSKYTIIASGFSYLQSFNQNGSFSDLIDFHQEIELLKHYFNKPYENNNDYFRTVI
jgi:hypothetical protein